MIATVNEDIPKAEQANLEQKVARANFSVPIKGAISRWHGALNVAATALPVAGAIGTLAVWLIANFYIGDVQLLPDRGYKSIEVIVSNRKGQETIFHSTHFQLMPGKYHLAVTIDAQSRQDADIRTVFRQNIVVPLHMPENMPPHISGSLGESNTEITHKSSAELPGEAARRRWWQFWKKTNAEN